MLSLLDKGIVLEDDWGWPVSVVEMLEGDLSLFWMVWCAQSNGDHPCDCKPTPPVGLGATEQEALERWRFVHFETRYQGKKRQR